MLHVSQEKQVNAIISFFFSSCALSEHSFMFVLSHWIPGKMLGHCVMGAIAQELATLQPLQAVDLPNQLRCSYTNRR
jgi:hypothetical protein